MNEQEEEMKKKTAALLLGCMLALAGCGTQAPADSGSTEDASEEAMQEAEETEESGGTVEEEADNGEASVENADTNDANADTSDENADTDDGAADTDEETAVVDVELDYAKGIADGVYGWVLSEDESYYMLCTIDENGEPVESAAKQMGFGGMGPGGGAKDGQGGPGGGMGPRDGQGGPGKELGVPEGEAGKADDPLAMEQNLQAMTQQVNAQGVYTESNITNTEYQTMLVFVPADYMTVGEDGLAQWTDQAIGNYTAETAPIVFQNGNGGWRSGSPKAPEFADTLKAGMIYVSCGSRSRDAVDENGTITGKAPMAVVDLKAGVIAVRANADVIPGDKDKMISVGSSGGGQMSSALGATGNMEEYYPYLYEAGAIGVSYDEEKDSYTSEYDDSVFAAMCYCPIADIDNADLAYAWFRYDSTTDADGNLTSTAGDYDFSEFQLKLQQDEAKAFGEYINGLGLKDADGQALVFEEKEDGSLDLRAGTFYDATIKNISNALNATLAVEDDPAGYLSENYGDTSAWLKDNGDGTYAVTDLAAFLEGTGLARNKDIPGFDTLDLSAENDAFGTTDDTAVHFSASVAKVMQEHYDEYSQLDGFDASVVDAYIENALTGDGAKGIAEQTYLVNATQIMLDVAAGKQEADVAEYWRTRNGTADEHTSFSVAYDICMAAQMAGREADYALVWAMNHGSNEGTTTGTFVDWIQEICAK